MMKTLSILGMIAASAALMTPAASALTAKQIQQCNALAKSLKTRQGKAKLMVSEREALTQRVEDAGDTWEDKEATRLFSAENAMAADESRNTYEALKADLMSHEMTLQDFVYDLNQDTRRYNRTCTTK